VKLESCEPPDWLDELNLEPGPPWLHLGTRALRQGWVTSASDAPIEANERARLLDTRHDEVFAALPSADAPSAELLAMVEATTGTTGRAELHPLDAAGRLVVDDLCMLVDHEGDPRLDGASLCFPSYWRLGDKLGRPITEVHGPVAHYETELAERVDRALRSLRPERPVWRRNWSIHDDPTLFLPDPTPPRAVEPPDGLWLRSERQTLRRLPRTEAIVFTIRTQQVPLATLSRRPDIARLMANAIEAWSPALARYKGSHGALTARKWLDEVGVRG
jgi:hypothetical protein